MNILVTGGTRVLGQPVVSRLVQGGHHVRALARSERGVELLRALGAEPVAFDLFDPSAVSAAVDGVDAILQIGRAHV